MPFSPCQFSTCTLASQATAGGSWCCPLISHYPLCFKSIVNYLQKKKKKSSLLIQLEKWTARGRQKFAWQGIQCYAGWKLSSHHCYLLAHQCPSQKLAFHFALHRHFLSLYHTFSISHVSADTHRDTNIHAQFLSICPSLAKNPMFNKRLHLWWGEGQANGEICPHVLNLGEALALTH